MNNRLLMTAVLVLGITFAALPVSADMPQMLQYQGRVTDSMGNPVTQNNVSLRFLLYTQEIGGSFIWAEVLQKNIVDGLFSHQLGSVVALPDTFFIAFDSLWLEILVQGEAQTPRHLLLPSAYSFRVQTVHLSHGGTVDGDIILKDTLDGHSLHLRSRGQDNMPQIAMYPTGLAIPRVDIRSSEISGDGAEMLLYNGDNDRTIEIDAHQAGSSEINLYHKRASIGAPVKTLELKASADGAVGGRVEVKNIGSLTTVELHGEYGGLDGEGRIGVNADPDTATLHVNSTSKYAGYFSSTFASAYPAVVKAEFRGGDVTDPIAVWGDSWPSDGKGSGGFFRGGEHGVRAIAQGGDATYTCSALQGYAYGDAASGQRCGVYAIGNGGSVAIGVYGFASAGDRNWSSYFAGESWMSRLAIGTDYDAVTGTNDPVPAGYSLAVNGKVLCEEVEVLLSESWPDYVFGEDYELMSLEEIEAAIDESGHLPGIPSAEQVESSGVAIGSMQAKLLEKVEEMTLHLIELNKQVKQLQAENAELRTTVADIQEQPSAEGAGR